MSLLNKVLKQIEQQRQKHPPATDIAGEKGEAEKLTPKRNMFSLRLLVWVVFFLIIVIGAYLFFQKEQTLKAMLALQGPKKAVSIVKEKPPEVPAVSAIRWESGDAQHARLMIELSRQVHFVLNRNPESKVISLTLKGVVLPQDIKLPEINANAVASSLKVEEKDQGVTINLEVNPHVKIHTVEHSTQKGAVLSVHFAVQPQKTAEENVKQVVITPEERIEQGYQQAVEEVTAGNLQSAANLLENLVKEDPASQKLQLALAQVYFQKADYTQADKILVPLLASHSHNLPAAVLKARVYLAQKQEQAALGLLLKYDPPLIGHEDFYNMLAAVELLNKHYTDAAGYYGQLLKADPNHSAWWLGYALSQANLHQFNAAQTAYERALATGQLTPPLQVFVHKQLDLLKGQR